MTARLDQPSSWSSLQDQLSLAACLFGDRGAALVGRWLKRRIDYVADVNAARRFAAAMSSRWRRPKDFADRIVEGEGLRLLGGIRFFGGDRKRPFVDALAWTELGDGGAEQAIWPRLGRLIAREWASFAPRSVRVLTPPATPLPDARRDLDLHAAPYGSMRGSAPNSRRRVRLEPFDDISAAARLVRQRYEALSLAEPELGTHMAPADAEDLSRCAASGGLFAIRFEDGGDAPLAGVLATEPGEVAWLEGDVIVEEVVSAPFAGLGLAAEAQLALADLRADRPGRLLIGTIDDLNEPSRKTALRAGRPPLLRYAFLPLG